MKKNIMINSKIAYLTSPYQLIFKDEIIDDDCLKKGFILCETLVSVISPGTEIAAYTGSPPLRPGKIYPRLVGYCNVARVIKVGADVSSVSEGDRVLTGSCHCSHFLIAENDIFSVIPDAVESRHAACAYLYHLGYDVVLKSGLSYGAPVVVLGLGVLGLGAVAMSSRAGGNVYAVSDYSTPAKIAGQFGVKRVFSRAEFADLKNLLGDRLSDVVISTSNSWLDWDLALQIAGRNSFIGVIGFPGRGLNSPKNNPLDSQYFYAKQLHIQAVGHAPVENDTRQFLKFNQKDNLSFILSEIEAGYLNPDLLISGVFSWDKLEDAYNGLIERVDSPITYALEWKK
jgi:threonine dehydrogenase-like Zn-dependent dehydrogenase